MELIDMEPKIEAFRKQGAERRPPGNLSPRTSGYRIKGQGFGDQPGQVEIEYARDDETFGQCIKSWSDTFIEIERPGRDPYDWSVWINDLFVIRADGTRSHYFELVRPGIPYYGPIRAQDRPASRLRRAA